MHVAVNGWFWDRPGTGSGQYIRRLVAAFAQGHPDLHITLVVPRGVEVDPPGDTVAVHPVGPSGRGDWAKLRFEQWTFPAAAGALGADLAHVPYWGGPLRSPIPVVVTIHDLIPLILPPYRGGPLARLYTGLVAASARGAAMVITDSAASQADIIDHLSLPPDRVRAIHLAAGEMYHPGRAERVEVAVREKYDLPDTFVLYLGGYDVRKNVETLLEAYTYVREATADAVPLVLAGRLPEHRSPRFSDVPFLVEKLNLADVIHPIGWVDEGETPALYRLAACFVYPSRYEGFGLPALEAMACGTPVVAGDAASLPEIVGDAGFLVAPDDARAMAGAILAALNQDDFTAGLCQRGLERAAAFTWAHTAAQTREVYERVIAESRP